MSLLITRVRTIDLRFPTSKQSIGSDAVNTAPDYSAAYCILETNGSVEGHGLTFTLGRGTELCVAAIDYLSRFVVGRKLSDITENLAAFSRALTEDSQFRWLGPEKGVIHMAAGALINAVWDLYAKVEGKPLWLLLAAMSPEQIVTTMDFRYIDDALTPFRGAADAAGAAGRNRAPASNNCARRAIRRTRRRWVGSGSATRRFAPCAGRLSPKAGRISN